MNNIRSLRAYQLGDKINPVIALLALLLLIAAFPVSDGEAAPGAETLLADDYRSCEVPSNVSGPVRLPSDCRYARTLVIGQSDTHLDCAGALFEGFGDRAIIIRPGIHDVSVRDCHLNDTGGLLIEGHQLENVGANREDARLRSSSGVVISRMTITRSRMTGVFIDHFVVGATVENSIVSQGAAPGIYLEYGSRKNEIRGNVISGNGHFTNQGIRRLALTRREGLSIDASTHNLVENNVFDGNAMGGVFLYKNCWEYHTSNLENPPRVQHASSNVIRSNSFKNMPVGVWIAARQSRDLLNWDCGDDSPYDNPVAFEGLMKNRRIGASDELLSHSFNPEFLAGFVTFNLDEIRSPFRTGVSLWEDFAEDTTVTGNCFEDLGTGVRVEDDRARIVGNRFVGDFEYLYLGSVFRTRLLNKPVLDTVIAENNFASPKGASFAEHATIVSGEHIGTRMMDNVPWASGIDKHASVRDVCAQTR